MQCTASDLAFPPALSPSHQPFLGKMPTPISTHNIHSHAFAAEYAERGMLVHRDGGAAVRHVGTDTALDGSHMAL